MAEGSRMKTIEENIRKLEQLQQQQARSLNRWMESTKSNLEEFHKEIPSFETKIQESRPQLVNANSRSRIFDDNLRKMQALAEQHASMMQQWWPSTNQNMTESHQETQFSARAPSNIGVELNLEAKSAKQDHGTWCSLTKDQEIEKLQEFSAHKVFVKMSKKEWNDVDECVKLLSTLGHFLDSVDSSRSFLFDPGKSNKFLLHNGSVEALVTLVFDPGGDQALAIDCCKTSDFNT